MLSWDDESTFMALTWGDCAETMSSKGGGGGWKEGEVKLGPIDPANRNHTIFTSKPVFRLHSKRSR